MWNDIFKKNERQNVKKVVNGEIEKYFAVHHDGLNVAVSANEH